jgi:hypothetical protein
LYLFANVANGEGVPVKRVAAADLHGAIAYMQNGMPSSTFCVRISSTD